MEKQVIKVESVCDSCQGTGALAHPDGRMKTCFKCDGTGKTIEHKIKYVDNDYFDVNEHIKKWLDTKDNYLNDEFFETQLSRDKRILEDFIEFLDQKNLVLTIIKKKKRKP